MIIKCENVSVKIISLPTNFFSATEIKQKHSVCFLSYMVMSNNCLIAASILFTVPKLSKSASQLW